MTVSEQIAQFVRELDYDSIPDEVRELLTTSVYNYFGCLYAGLDEPAPKTVEKMLDEWFPSGACRLPNGHRADPMSAAMYYGTAANAIGFDDMYSPGIYHPGIPAVTGAVVACELSRVTGRQFLEAVAVGYETGCRLAKLINPSHYTYWHTACTVGAIASAMSAGKALGLSQTELINALGAAGTQSSGLQECTDNMAIRLHHGIAARNGVASALLAKSGFDGPKHILDGKAGFVAAMSDYSGDILERFSDLGEKWLIRDVTIKFYPCCGHIHGCLDAVIMDMENNSLSPSQIKKLRIGSYKTAVEHNDNPKPKDPQQAKFSIQYCAAVAALLGRCGMEEFDSWPPRQDVLDMMGKVELFVDSESESGFPEGRRGAVCIVQTDAGEYSWRCQYRRGDPASPLNRKDILEKYLSLAKRSLPEEKALKLSAIIDALPELTDSAALVEI